MILLLSVLGLSGCGAGAQEEKTKIPITIASLEEPIKMQSEVQIPENTGIPIAPSIR